MADIQNPIQHMNDLNINKSTLQSPPNPNTTNEITTNEITTNEITTNEITTNDVTSKNETNPETFSIKMRKFKPVTTSSTTITTKETNESSKDYTHDLTSKEVNDLIDDAEWELASASYYLSEAREIAKQYGLSVDSSILDPAYQTPLIPTNKIAPNNNKMMISSDSYQAHYHQYVRSSISPTNNNTNNNNKNNTNLLFPHFHILSTTGGHSNTDHIVVNTGDAKFDRFTELKRNLKRRARSMQPENKGEDRWDQPRFPGQRIRRRRITREADLPCAPPEPPLSGYILFVAQMTAKAKYDRRLKYNGGGGGNGSSGSGRKGNSNSPPPQHDQIKVVREISKIWRHGMKQNERQYYLDFAMSAKMEYNHQIREFRATGGYTPSTTFMKLGEGPWVRKIWHEKNELERELATYPMDIFKLQPDKRSKEAKNQSNSNSKNENSNHNTDNDDIIDENNLISYDFQYPGVAHANINDHPSHNKVKKRCFTKNFQSIE